MDVAMLLSALFRPSLARQLYSKEDTPEKIIRASQLAGTTIIRLLTFSLFPVFVVASFHLTGTGVTPLTYATSLSAIIFVLSGRSVVRRLAFAAVWAAGALLFSAISLLTGWDWQKALGLAWGIAWGMTVSGPPSVDMLYGLVFALFWGGLSKLLVHNPVLPYAAWGGIGYLIGIVRLPVWIAEIFLPRAFLYDELMVLPHPHLVRWLREAVRQDVGKIAVVARNPYLRWAITWLDESPRRLLSLLNNPPEYIAPSDRPDRREKDKYFVVKTVFAELGKVVPPFPERIVYFLTAPLRKNTPPEYVRLFRAWYELLEAVSSEQPEQKEQLNEAIVNAIEATQPIDNEIADLLRAVWAVYSSESPVVVSVPPVNTFETVANYIGFLNVAVEETRRGDTPKLPPIPAIEPFETYLRAVANRWWGDIVPHK